MSLTWLRHLFARPASPQDGDHYAELVEQSVMGILLRSPDGQIVLVNEAFCRLTGYSRQELMHLNVRQLVAAADPDVVERSNRMIEGESGSQQTYIRRKDGSQVHVEAITQRLQDGNLQSTLQDITVREQAEQARGESEARFRVVVESAPNALLLVDAKGLITLVNAQAEKLFGYPRTELLGQLIDILVPPSVKPRHPELRQRFFSDPGPRYLGGDRNITAVRKDGTPVPVEIGLAPIHIEDGLFALVSVVDVSERTRAEQARRESEQRYADLVEQAADSIWLRLSTGQMLYVNDAACNMLGYTRAELLETGSLQLIHSSDPGTAARIDALKPLETLRIERIMRHRDGHAIPVEASVRRLKDGSVQVISHDISERKRIQQARDESEHRYAELVDQALEGIMVRRTDGQVLFVNHSFCRMLGYSREELLKLNIHDIVHPDDAETLVQIQKLKVGGSLWLQKRMRRKDGQAIHVEVSAKRLHSGDIQTTVQDVSERKHAEQRFRSMVEGAPNAMIMADERGVIALVNPQAERLFGYAREEMEGKSVEMLVPMRSRAQHPGLREGYQHDPRMRSMGGGRDLFGVHKDGHEVPVEIGLNPIASPEGRFVLASIIDITERKLAEAREREYMEELRLMSQQLLEAQETERRAIARELHDEVGQSLTATRINLRDLEQLSAGGPLAQRLTDASSIIAELLSKVRQMSLDLHPSVLDDLGLGPALRWCVRTRTTGSDMQVTLDVPEDLPRFGGSVEITLFRVFQEALSNALRHAGAKQLTARVRHADGVLTLVVEDDGCGFDAVAARKHALSGKSLGLVGMQERIRLAGGEIRVESAPGKGAKIQVSLPQHGR